MLDGKANHFSIDKQVELENTVFRSLGIFLHLFCAQGILNDLVGNLKSPINMSLSSNLSWWSLGRMLSNN